jgi:hypothetical protein
MKAAGRLVGAGMVAAASLLGVLAPASAQAQASDTTQASAVAHLRHDIAISVDMAYRTVKQGEAITYNSVVTNQSTEPSPPLCLAMNIVNMNAAGDIVDPEDWSPQRTQYLETLAPGQSSTFAWRVNAILDGDYLIYMVAIPEPTGADATSLPVASSGIHLTVTKFTKLNPRGVLPYAIGGPVILTLGIIYLLRRRRQDIDSGATK